MQQQTQLQQIYTPPVNPADIIQKRKYIEKINLYVKNFPEYLTHFDLNNLNTKSLQEVEMLADEVKFTVGCRNSSQQLEGFFIVGSTLIENLGPMLGLQTKGLTGMLVNKTNLDTVKEIGIEMSEMVYTEPHIRLTQMILMTTLACHRNNRSANLLDKPIREEIKNKYNDL